MALPKREKNREKEPLKQNPFAVLKDRLILVKNTDTAKESDDSVKRQQGDTEEKVKAAITETVVSAAPAPAEQAGKSGEAAPVKVPGIAVSPIRRAVPEGADWPRDWKIVKAWYEDQYALTARRGNNHVPVGGRDLERSVIGNPVYSSDQLKKIEGIIELNQSVYDFVEEEAANMADDDEKKIPGCREIIMKELFGKSKKTVEELETMTISDWIEGRVLELLNTHPGLSLNSYYNMAFKQWFKLKYPNPEKQTRMKKALLMRIYSEFENVKRKEKLQNAPFERVNKRVLGNESTKMTTFMDYLLHEVQDRVQKYVKTEVKISFVNCLGTVMDKYLGTDFIFMVEMDRKKQNEQSFIQFDVTNNPEKTNESRGYDDVVILTFDLPTDRQRQEHMNDRPSEETFLAALVSQETVPYIARDLSDETQRKPVSRWPYIEARLNHLANKMADTVIAEIERTQNNRQTKLQKFEHRAY